MADIVIRYIKTDQKNVRSVLSNELSGMVNHITVRKKSQRLMVKKSG